MVLEMQQITGAGYAIDLSLIPMATFWGGSGSASAIHA
jgi:hypothetical protein